MNDKNCAIIVSSFDGYSDAWHPFFTLFFKYWSDCELPIYLIGNYLSYHDKRVKTLNIIPDKKWASNLKIALNKIKEDYVIYLQEDYFLTEKISSNEINKMIDIIKNEQAAYLRFSEKQEMIKYKDFDNTMRIPKSSGYLNSTQAAIWEKRCLIDILKDGETGWDFEREKGLRRARSIEKPFLCTTKNILPYFRTAIVKGVYVYDALLFCEKEGIKINPHILRKETHFQSFIRKSKIYKKIKQLYGAIKS